MPETIDSDTYQITWLIRRVFRAMGQATGEYLEDLGVSAADRAVMEFLYPHRKLSVPEIARRYQVSRQHVQVTVNSLTDKGLVHTEENPDHKRSPLITLEDRGRELFEAILSRDEEALEKLFAGVSPSERREVRRVLEKVFNNLSRGMTS